MGDEHDSTQLNHALALIVRHADAGDAEQAHRSCGATRAFIVGACKLDGVASGCEILGEDEELAFGLLQGIECLKSCPVDAKLNTVKVAGGLCKNHDNAGTDPVKRDAAREILRALKNGEAVGILIDQNTTLDEGVFVDFFGTKACAGSAFVKLAHHSGAAVVPGYALWSDAERKYVLRFDPHIPMSGDVLADTQDVHSHLESVIRKHPEQYLWIHRRWKTRPPGEPPLY